MNTGLQKQLQRLALGQQNRIWIKRMLDLSPPLMWWSAGILFVGGSIHQMWVEMNVTMVVIIALLPSVIIFAWMSMRQRPNLQQAAASFDQQAGANSMFVSAWEISNSTTATTGIQGLLLARTYQYISDWSSCFHKQPQRTMPPSNLVAISAGLIGLFFLLLSPHVQSTVEAIEKPSTISSALIKTKPAAGALKDLLASKPVTQSVKVAPGLENFTEESTQELFETRLNKNRHIPDQQGELSNLAKVAASPDHVTSSTSTGTESQNSTGNPATKVAEKMPGNDSSTTSDSMLEKGSNLERIKQVDFHTQNDKHSVASAASLQGVELIPSQPGQPVQQVLIPEGTNILPGALPTQLNAQQRSMVRRYFTQLEKKHDVQ